MSSVTIASGRRTGRSGTPFRSAEAAGGRSEEGRESDPAARDPFNDPPPALPQSVARPA